MARRCEKGKEHLHTEPDLRTSRKRTVMLGAKSYLEGAFVVLSSAEKNLTTLAAVLSFLKLSGCYTYR